MSKSLEVTIHGTYPLSATLTIPEESTSTYPAILFISGSGKGDRDGNLKNMPMNIYKDLADFLTSKGFITLRYDKRGIGNSGGKFIETGVNDFIDDAVDGLKYLEAHPKVDANRILILGHSEGALIAPAVNQRKAVSGLILLAGAAEPNKDLLPRQNEMAFAELNQKKGLQGWMFRTFKLADKARKQNKKIFAKIANSNKDVMRIQGFKQNAKWLRELYTFNTCDYLKDVTCPVLAITGDKDIQVPPDHAKLIAEMVKGDAEWEIIPNMNHIFRKYEGQHAMLTLIKEYKKQVHEPIDEDLLKRLDTWLERFQN
ncbi:pimeloyl-ACP methyl ester carboxylesterase [Metabacillus malikii]|uniref:Pimeloyl-ACP methyl ester carboxylesterase n=2 Tax=Metabacillus malikii TaxID=1504265 RepID=A0ABT9ZIG5_9BACI|nr:pimeloyl-ACP methyl ester carboxylesterase [Metabacillus malikii]